MSTSKVRKLSDTQPAPAPEPSPEWRSAFNAALTGLLARTRATDVIVSNTSIGLVAAAREIADLAMEVRPMPLMRITVTILAIVPEEEHLLATVRVSSKEFPRPFDVPLAREVAKDLKVGQTITIAYQP